MKENCWGKWRGRKTINNLFKIDPATQPLSKNKNYIWENEKLKLKIKNNEHEINEKEIKNNELNQNIENLNYQLENKKNENNASDYNETLRKLFVFSMKKNESK